MPGFEEALAALDSAQVVHCVRKRGRNVHQLGGPDDLDLLVHPASVPAAQTALRSAGFRCFWAPGHTGHRFYLAIEESGRWRKVDLVTRLRASPGAPTAEGVLARRQRVDGVWLPGAADEEVLARAADQDVPRAESVWRRARRLRPPSWRRRTGPVLAILGPDGAGKGSVIDGLVAQLPIGVTRVDLGRQSAQVAGAAPAPPRRVSALSEVVFLLHEALVLTPKLMRIYLASWQGHVVLCDRHPCELLAIGPTRTRTGAALEQALFVGWTPAPDRIVVLDAPSEVLHRRKGEHDVETLERWRRNYLQEFVPPGVAVDASGPVEQTMTAVLRVVWEETWKRRAGGAALTQALRRRT